MAAGVRREFDIDPAEGNPRTPEIKAEPGIYGAWCLEDTMIGDGQSFRQVGNLAGIFIIFPLKFYIS